MKTVLALAAAALFAITTNVAVAEGTSDNKSLTVQFADLDLNRPAGIATLFQRIKSAAKSVCEVHRGETLPAKRAYAACVDLALSTAVARVNRPMLSDYVVRRSEKERSAPVTSVVSR